MRPSFPSITKRPSNVSRQLRELPAFRGLLRAVETDFYQDLPMPEPVLDLGCGDGHFAEATFAAPLDVGLDSSWPPLKETALRGHHSWLTHADGAAMPFPSASFGTVVSNSVLEHIPELDPVLEQVARVMKSGGWFHFTVPGPEFRSSLSVARALDTAGLASLAERYRRFFDRISRHCYYLSPDTWRERLARVGLDVAQWWPYFSPGALAALEWGYPLGLPCVLAKKLTGRWLVAPQAWNLALTEKLLRRFYDEPLTGTGVYLFFSVRKLAP